jgi:hypothetical protein
LVTLCTNTSCLEQRGVHAGHGELPAECGGAVRPTDRHGGAAAWALARPHSDPRAQRHQPRQHRDCQGEHAPGRRLYLPGNHVYGNAEYASYQTTGFPDFRIRISGGSYGSGSQSLR